jgi:hypothetical protein
MNNDAIRRLFLNYCDNHHSPNLKKLAKAMGISYFSLIKWKNDKRQFSALTLEKVIAFISK